MATKTISITEEAYERLKMRKEPRESFTDVINRITGRRDIMEFAGILTDEDAEKMKEHIRKMRESSTERINKIREALK
ncbi:MAG TPA: antitoxin VapB family protein [Candidatus Nanoarchaeia archaeon]|nr:antitoxin VapB family protein [Candidatus Nanoarchaeia archaeon]